ncbi:MAG: hypothetical protein A3A98_03025 [Candidatus Staskawiczbacteria bacterium RIFCSPLOWO2_01_FULL_40_39]|uniref:Uncharacterized protein n=1 Tax=Candidatus Staskawiczbacteria bacterium RIFCSPHIGHO2_01_FULL_39_25 TaxID=1802202 RepID=A0A1G2HPP2_9BACT|nr:MAG: hypothetical protein A2730_01490 [Candidatus Staskawiczbacteria bacterium RIFCSPHIGHO2_01_FULL_39_25]OGZ73860.1 MAG: hypothetical protein A3A98_03025 [Candidatus Staskawiczbacteria bacterium RIFCSPLOWO2_01_FULL_40_39]OGZ75897.1 MAG: hypothetical protein A3I87_00055 [Candidatus Staskawiczbacteria bacterium RIFCSPLOWO2_02_FULL_39_8]
MHNQFRPVLEALEDRLVPAGALRPRIPVPMPWVRVINQQVAPLDILPGASNQPIAAMTLKTVGPRGSRGFARLDEMIFIPASGSDSLAQNVRGFTLRADMNGVAADGYEKIISYASADWESDVVDFTVFRPVWVRSSHPVRMQVVADFWNYLSGDSLGMELAHASFKNLRNATVPDRYISYRGAEPALHTLESHMIDIYQVPMEPASAIVSPGQKNVSLLQFQAWSNAAVLTSVSFIASQGSLQNAENYRLVHTDNNGFQDNIIQGAFVDDKLIFSFTTQPFQPMGTWTVQADIKPPGSLSGDMRLQLSFIHAGFGFSATDLETGNLLRGFIFRGVSEDQNGGQVQLWASEDSATSYTIVA